MNIFTETKYIIENILFACCSLIRLYKNIICYSWDIRSNNSNKPLHMVDADNAEMSSHMRSVLIKTHSYYLLYKQVNV